MSYSKCKQSSISNLFYSTHSETRTDRVDKKRF
jgi:hypothetical protein